MGRPVGGWRWLEGFRHVLITKNLSLAETIYCQYHRSVEYYPPYSAQFRLSITKAFSDQLVGTIEDLEPVLLDNSALDALPSQPGVYQLYRRGTVVYVGKTDESLPGRLKHHLRKISGRQNISLSEMTFTCLYLAEDLSAVAPEILLVKHYQARGEASWNTGGFGGRDPGRRRDTTKVAAAHFDAYFPIDLNVQVNLPAGQATMKQLLQSLKDSLPYTFRYDRTLVSAVELAMTSPFIMNGHITAREAFRLVLKGLSTEWQLTALPGRAILYKEVRPDVYDSALAWWRSDQEGTVSETSGPRLFDDSADVSPDDNLDEDMSN